LADINREIALPAEHSSPFIPFVQTGFIGTDVLKLKAGFLYGDVPKVYRLKQGIIAVTTDATVKNRNITCKTYMVSGGAEQIICYPASGAIPASTTDSLAVGQQVIGSTGRTVVPDCYGFTDIILQGDDRFEIAIPNNAAGDIWQVWLLFEYLNRLYGITGL